MTVAWNADPKALSDLLRQRSRDLEELYVQAIEALSCQELSQTRLMIAGHCLRELFSGLARVLGDPVKNRSDVNRPALELSRAWIGGGLTLTGGLGQPASLLRRRGSSQDGPRVGRGPDRYLTRMRPEQLGPPDPTGRRIRV
jgi:hypothetical protein